MSEKAPKKQKSKARTIIEWTLTIVFGLAFAFAGAAQIEGLIHRDQHFGQTLRFGWGSFVVLTDSMEPEYPVDSAIITHLDEPQSIYDAFLAGETVDLTFQNGAEQIPYTVRPTDPAIRDRVDSVAVFTHRVFEVRINEDAKIGEGHFVFFVAGINTQGSNWKAAQYQVLTERSILGRVKANSPALGWFFRVLSSPWGLLIFLLIPSGYLVVVSVLDIFKAMKDPEEAKAAEGGNGGGEALATLSEEDKKRLKEEMLAQMLEERQKGDKK